MVNACPVALLVSIVHAHKCCNGERHLQVAGEEGVARTNNALRFHMSLAGHSETDRQTEINDGVRLFEISNSNVLNACIESTQTRQVAILTDW